MASRTERPVVTIVTPSLNQARTIGAALRSVRSQTYPRIEHIVVDGGSIDGTLDVLAAAATETGLRWRSGPDDGMYDAVNKGLGMTTGEIVGYLNSDDLLLPWAVEVAVDELERTGADLVYGDALRLDEPSGRIELKLQVPFDVGRLVRHGSLVQPAVFWRRDLQRTVGNFDPDLQFVGDLDYWLRAGQARVVHVDEVFAVYRTHPATKTHRSRGPMRAEEMRVRRRHDPGGRGGLARQIVARLSHGLAVRGQLLRFALAGSSNDRWGRFRGAARPQIVWWRFCLAFLPLAGRLPVQHFLRVRRRPWDESG